MSDGLPMLEVSGSPTEGGWAHGEAFREAIGTLLPAYFEYMERISRACRVPALTKARALEISRAYRGPAERYAPDLLAEVRGIAEGRERRSRSCLR